MSFSIEPAYPGYPLRVFIYDIRGPDGACFFHSVGLGHDCQMAALCVRLGKNCTTRRS